MYPLLTAGVLASFLFLIRYRDDRGRWNAAGYVTTTTVVVYAHTYGPFCLPARAGFDLTQRLASVVVLVRRFRRQPTVWPFLVGPASERTGEQILYGGLRSGGTQGRA